MKLKVICSVLLVLQILQISKAALNSAQEVKDFCQTNSTQCTVVPENCLSDGTCTGYVTAEYEKNFYLFSLVGSDTSNSFAALGFSSDRNMGNDSVVECRLIDGAISIRSSYNQGHSHVSLQPDDAITNQKTAATDGQIYCQFSIDKELITGDYSVKIPSDEAYYLLVAVGKLNDTGYPTQHSRNGRAASTTPQVFNSAVQISFTLSTMLIMTAVLRAFVVELQ